jgi:iron complex transport system permease protein
LAAAILALLVGARIISPAEALLALRQPHPTNADHVSFPGLMVPELARRMAAQKVRAQMLAPLCLGPAALLVADAIGRVILYVSEVRAGLMTALVGGPVCIAIARRIRPGAVA